MGQSETTCFESKRKVAHEWLNYIILMGFLDMIGTKDFR